MIQIYMILTELARNLLMAKISLIEPMLVSMIQKELGLDSPRAIRFMIPAPIIYAKRVEEIQIQIHCIVNKGKHNKGESINPSLEEQENLAKKIRDFFLDFPDEHEGKLPRLSLSVSCILHHNSSFKSLIG